MRGRQEHKDVEKKEGGSGVASVCGRLGSENREKEEERKEGKRLRGNIRRRNRIRKRWKKRLTKVE